MAIQLTLELHHLFLLQFIYEIYLFYVFGNKKIKTIFSCETVFAQHN